MRGDKLNKLSIQNFKAFGEMVDVPIRPITLIFGENSSGKSSILHSLLFLNQMQHQPQDQLADITYTKVGGNSVDLGGLPQLKYGHSNERALSFLIEMPMPIYTPLLNKTPQEKSPIEPLFSFMFNFTKTNELDQIIFNFSELPFLSLTHYYRQNNRLDSGLSFNLDVDNFIKCMNNQMFLTGFEALHKSVKSFLQSRPHINLSESEDDKVSSANNKIEDFSKYANQNTILNIDIKLNSRTNIESAYPNILNIVGEERLLPLLLIVKSFKLSVHSSNNLGLENYKLSMKDKIKINNHSISFDDLSYTLWVYFCTKFRRITKVLSSSLYLGPVRTIPTRNFDTLDSIARDPSTGSVAWDVLTNNTTARDQVNNWLEKFGTNKQLTTEQLMDTAQLRRLLSEYTERTQLESAINKLTTRNMLRFYDPQKEIYLSHRDLGVGISQVLPVIVNCVANNNTTVLIEQPELHLHPRLQGDLADLFIETAITGKQKNTYLLETHSEALILRLLRRVREGVIKPDDIAILYVSPSDKGSMVKHIRIDEDGDFMDRWPNGFFEETYRDRMGF